jgi:hypothetical protein
MRADADWEALNRAELDDGGGWTGLGLGRLVWWGDRVFGAVVRAKVVVAPGKRGHAPELAGDDVAETGFRTAQDKACPAISTPQSSG